MVGDLETNEGRERPCIMKNETKRRTEKRMDHLGWDCDSNHQKIKVNKQQYKQQYKATIVHGMNNAGLLRIDDNKARRKYCKEKKKKKEKRKKEKGRERTNNDDDYDETSQTITVITPS